jgi:hypothetical protein
MIVDMSFRFLYLIFDRLLGWLMMLGRASSSMDIERRCCVGEEEAVSSDRDAVQMARESSVKIASRRRPGSV